MARQTAAKALRLLESEGLVTRLEPVAIGHGPRTVSEAWRRAGIPRPARSPAYPALSGPQRLFILNAAHVSYQTIRQLNFCSDVNRIMAAA